MRIDITGYVTEPLVSYSFAIKVTGDSVERLSRSNLQVSKEVRITILPYLYPLDDNSKFIALTVQDDPRLNDPCIEKIDDCLSFGRALSKGDQIECSVFIIDAKTRAINRNPNDIETYAKFDLWLYPNKGYFRRSESDSRESLKFRKQWRYACINREKCAKITGYGYKYRSRRWINKNPTIILPIIWWIQVKTTVSNLWERLIRQENSPKTSAHKLARIGIVVGIIGIVATIVVGIIGIIVSVIVQYVV